MNFKQFKKKYQKEEVLEFPHRVPATPVVSVMVQTYQHANYIKDCLDGILKQKTSFPFEILLGEDGSADGTREICLYYAKRNPEKIRLFLHHPANKIKVMGITTGNFNALYNFFSAKGEYIAFCEGDDYWNDFSKLQKQVNFLEFNAKYSLCFHSFSEGMETKEELIAQKPALDQPLHDLTSQDLKYLRFHPLLSTVCFRNLLNGEIPKGMLEVINVDSFLLSLLGNWGKGKFLNRISPSYYRRHPEGLWSGTSKELSYNSKILTYERLVQFYHDRKEFEVENAFLERINQLENSSVYFNFQKGNFIKGLYKLFRKFV